jgi:hypothetical protein
VYFDLWSMLVFMKRVVSKSSNGVGKEKNKYAKKW